MPEHDLDAKIALRSAKLPSKSPLLVCRRIHSESRGIYKSAYRKFWTESKFVIHRYTTATTLPRTTSQDIAKYSAQDIQHITKLAIRELGNGEFEITIELVNARGVWVSSFAEQNGSVHRSIVWWRMGSLGYPQGLWEEYSPDNLARDWCGSVVRVSLRRQICSWLNLEEEEEDGQW